MKIYIRINREGLAPGDAIVEAPSIQALVDVHFPGDEIWPVPTPNGDDDGTRHLYDPDLGYVWAELSQVEDDAEVRGLVAPKTSITGWCQRRPPQRRYVDRGQVIHTARTNMVLVPLEPTGGRSWDCQVIVGTEVYRPTGYRLSVGEDELMAGTLIAPEAVLGLVQA